MTQFEILLGKHLKGWVNKLKALQGSLVDTFMVIKGDYILPNHILFLDYVTQTEGEKWQWTDIQEWQKWLFKVTKSTCEANLEGMHQNGIFKQNSLSFIFEIILSKNMFIVLNIEIKNIDILSETEGVEPNTPLFIDNGPMLKILERRNYDKQKHLFPYNKWKTYELKGLRK